jgi:hypothetical protein
MQAYVIKTKEKQVAGGDTLGRWLFLRKRAGWGWRSTGAFGTLVVLSWMMNSQRFCYSLCPLDVRNI